MLNDTYGEAPTKAELEMRCQKLDERERILQKQEQHDFLSHFAKLPLFDQITVLAQRAFGDDVAMRKSVIEAMWG